MPSFVNCFFFLLLLFVCFFLIFEKFRTTADWSHRGMKISFWISAAVTKYGHLPDKGLRMWATQGKSPCSNISRMSWNSRSWSLRLELHEVAVSFGSRNGQSDG